MYKLTGDHNSVLRLADGASIPCDEGNRDYVEYLQWVEGGGVAAPAIDAPSLDARKESLKSEATALRWQRETGGITVAGVQVATGLDDQNRIATVLTAGQLGDIDEVDFKAATGWVRLTLAQIQDIAGAITAHVQSCFSAERAHHEAIDALPDLAAVEAYDVTSGWPA